jgi:hypothetical protein
MRTLHQRRKHPEFVESCWACRISTVGVGISAGVKAIDASERSLRRDLDAYKRLRLDGRQPEHLLGSAALEAKADHPLAVDHPKLWASLDTEGRAHVDEAMTLAREAPQGLKVAGK